MNRLFLFMTILVLGVPVYAQSEKRIDTKEQQENVNSRELKKQLAAIQDSIKVGSINSIFYFLHKAAEPFNCLEQDNLA